MTAIITQDEKKFMCYYYDNLCNDINRLNKLYTDKSIMNISFENGSSTSYNENFSNQLRLKTGKPVFMVFLSSMISQNIDANTSILSSVGQFVFNDKTQKRFSHQLIINKNDGSYTIKCENIVILNEEIVYENADGSVTVEIHKNNKTMVEIISILEAYGTVDMIENKINSFVCRMTHLDIKIDDLKNKIIESGVEIIL